MKALLCLGMFVLYVASHAQYNFSPKDKTSWEGRVYHKYKLGTIYGYSYERGSRVDLGLYRYHQYRYKVYSLLMLSYNFRQHAINKFALKYDASMSGFAVFPKLGVELYSDYKGYCALAPRIGLKVDLDNFIHLASSYSPISIGEHGISNNATVSFEFYLSLKRFLWLCDTIR